MKAIPYLLFVVFFLGGCGEEIRQESIGRKKEKMNAGPLGETFSIPDLDLTMIWVRPGSFVMGSQPNERSRNDDETPHQVTLTNGFYLGKHEITQAQWEPVMPRNPSHFKGGDRPVERVSWEDAVEFCKKLTEREREEGRLPDGMAYQLPTEAQWEYACRAGTTTAYSWGDSTNNTLANYGKAFTEGTKSVGQYPRNPWGFHDMHGNLWEWCADWYGDYPNLAVVNPTGPASGAFRVLRGGSWGGGDTFMRSAKRSSHNPDKKVTILGFRICLMKSR